MKDISFRDTRADADAAEYIFNLVNRKQFGLPNVNPTISQDGIIRTAEACILSRSRLRFFCKLALYEENRLPLFWPLDTFASVTDAVGSRRAPAVD